LTDLENTESSEEALDPSNSLYGTGIAGMFSDTLNRRYLTLMAVSVGVTVGQMSWLRGLQSLSQNILQPLWGQLIDRYGKRGFIALGRVLNGIVLFAVIFFHTPNFLIILIVATSICWSIVRPAWTSLLGDYTTTSTRGESIGLINSSVQVGGISAMILALIFNINQKGETTAESYYLILVMAALTSIISGILSFFTTEKPPRQDGEPLKLSRVMNDSMLRRFLFINLFFGISLAFAWPLFPFIIAEKLDLKIWQIAAYSIASSTTSMISQRYIGGLMDTIGRRPVIIFSRITMAITPIVYIFASSWIHIVLANILTGIGMAAWMSSSPTYIIDIAPRDLRATYLAANTAFFGIATFIGNMSGGYITNNILSTGSGYEGIHYGLMISAFLRILTGLLFMKIQETYKEE